MPDDVLTINDAGRGVRELILNRPDVHNALNLPLLKSLTDALADAEGDEAVRVLLLRGEGKSFCAGLDLKVAADPSQAEESTHLLSDVLTGLRASRLMVVCAAHGAAFGGGAGLLMASDLTVGDDSLKIGFPEVRRGIIPAMVSVLLRQHLGDRATREILLLGQTMVGEQIEAAGLLTRRASLGQSRAAALELIDDILAGGPETLAATKRLINDIAGQPFETAWTLAHDAHLGSRGSAEFAEGSKAFKEKRHPSWMANATQAGWRKID